MSERIMQELSLDTGTVPADRFAHLRDEDLYVASNQ